jgi:hypothetical protein
MRAWFCLLVIGCGGDSILDGLGGGMDCLSNTCGSHKYRFCRASGSASCAYVADDGQKFSCGSCDDCAGAAQEVDAWCMGFSSSQPDLATARAPAGGTPTSPGALPDLANPGVVDLASPGAADLGSGTLGQACLSCFASERAPGGSCTSQYDACAADAGCAAILACAASCITLDCIAACTGNAPGSSLGPAEMLYTCECQWCGAVCSGACGT